MQRSSRYQTRLEQLPLPILQLSLTDATTAAAVHAYAESEMTVEAMLSGLVMTFARERDRYRDELLERVRRSPAQAMIIREAFRD